MLSAVTNLAAALDVLGSGAAANQLEEVRRVVSALIPLLEAKRWNAARTSEAARACVAKLVEVVGAASEPSG
jgi:hypothetical protein